MASGALRTGVLSMAVVAVMAATAATLTAKSVKNRFRMSKFLLFRRDVARDAESDHVTGLGGPVTPRKTQFGGGGRAPVRSAVGVALAVRRAERIGDRRRRNERKILVVDPLGHIAREVVEAEGVRREQGWCRHCGEFVLVPEQHVA